MLCTSRGTLHMYRRMLLMCQRISDCCICIEEYDVGLCVKEYLTVVYVSKNAVYVSKNVWLLYNYLRKWWWPKYKECCLACVKERYVKQRCLCVTVVENYIISSFSNIVNVFNHLTIIDHYALSYIILKIFTNYYTT